MFVLFISTFTNQSKLNCEVTNLFLFSASSKTKEVDILPGSSTTRSEPPQQSGSGISVLDQLGCGSSDDFISKVAKLVTQRIADSNKLPSSPSLIPTDPNWRNYEITPPTVTSDAVSSKTTPPLNFANPITENDYNDSFDQSKLLTCIPKQFKQKASTLLKCFDERPNEITWDSTGNIYLDEQSLPNSNIFEVFPYLYRKRSKKSLQGLNDFILKIQSMGLGHLIYASVKVKAPAEKSTSNEKSLNPWWYLA